MPEIPAPSRKRTLTTFVQHVRSFFGSDWDQGTEYLGLWLHQSALSRKAFKEILALETPKCAHTAKKMAAIARKALGQ